MRIALCQYDIRWGDVRSNLDGIEECLLSSKVEADLLVLPEMFTTGFGGDVVALAEPMSGSTMERVKSWAARFSMAVVGSFVEMDETGRHNRAFLVKPDGSVAVYDKRHLFSMGLEREWFSAGTERTVVEYDGWRICLQICYDLRFPVFTRNAGEVYDLLIYVANWPSSRIGAWNILLPARAVENVAYVCGVNRVGEDGLGIRQGGCSSVYSFRGDALVKMDEQTEGIEVVELSLDKLRAFRSKFPALRDADSFSIQ